MRKGKVKRLTFNWRQVGSTDSSQGADEDYNQYEVGSRGVTEIIENEPHSGLQQWNYEISLDTGVVFRVFNPNFVEYFRIEK